MIIDFFLNDLMIIEPQITTLFKDILQTKLINLEKVTLLLNNYGPYTSASFLKFILIGLKRTHIGRWPLIIEIVCLYKYKQDYEDLKNVVDPKEICIRCVTNEEYRKCY